MTKFLYVLLFSVATYIQADTITNYVNISNDIPKMEIKADAEAQAWARSARHVISIADESILETMLQANEFARKQGKPLFCLPEKETLTTNLLNQIILDTYQNISSQPSDKEKMTVSEVAWIGIVQKYPCDNKTELSMDQFINQTRQSN